MIKKIIKLLTNPQGALVQLILDQVAKVFKLDKVLRYVEQDNVENKCTEIDLKIKAMQSLMVDLDTVEEVNNIKKELSKFKKIKSL